MPRKRRRAKARQRPGLSDDHCEHLILGICVLNHSENIFESDDARRATWFEHRDEIMARCSADHDQHHYKPGTRPSGWWDYQSPEPRRNLGGPYLQNGEGFWFGHPDSYSSPDPENPPVWESQISYLRRLNLLEPGEEARALEAAQRQWNRRCDPDYGRPTDAQLLDDWTRSV